MATTKKSTTKTTATKTAQKKEINNNPNKATPLWDNNLLRRFKELGNEDSSDAHAWALAKEQARSDLMELAKKLHVAAPGNIYFVGTTYEPDPFTQRPEFFEDICEAANTKSVGNALWRAVEFLNTDDAQLRVYLAAGQLVVAKRNPANNSGATMSLCSAVAGHGQTIDFDYIAENGIGLASLAKEALGK